MNNTQRVVIWLLLAVVFTQSGRAEVKPTYEAIIRTSGSNTRHVTIEARDYWEAKDRINGGYCGGTDCIVEGPWVRH